jgi:hypothetical protein
MHIYRNPLNGQSSISAIQDRNKSNKEIPMRDENKTNMQAGRNGTCWRKVVVSICKDVEICGSVVEVSR